MESILEYLKEWIKAHAREIVLFLVLFFIASLSFGLGYLFAQETNRAPIVIEKCSAAE